MEKTEPFDVAVCSEQGNSSYPIQDSAEYGYFQIAGEEVAFFVVADGMGGYEDGARASRTVIETVMGFLRQHLGANGHAPADILCAAIEQANTAVYDYTEAEEIRSGSTITCALISQGRAIIANVGDSRTYLYRHQQLEQITHDHSFVEELIRRNLMTPEERYENRYVNILTRGLGTAPEVEVDIFERILLPGDLLLLCSDGLSSTLRREEIAGLLDGAENLPNMSRNLVQAAITAGGKDHVTAMLVRWLVAPADGRHYNPS